MGVARSRRDPDAAFRERASKSSFGGREMVRKAPADAIVGG